MLLLLHGNFVSPQQTVSETLLFYLNCTTDVYKISCIYCFAWYTLNAANTRINLDQFLYVMVHSH